MKITIIAALMGDRVDGVVGTPVTCAATFDADLQWIPIRRGDKVRGKCPLMLDRVQFSDKDGDTVLYPEGYLRSG